MRELWWFVPAILALASIWMALYHAPRWFLRVRIRDRLLNTVQGDGEEGKSWLTLFAERFAGHSVTRGDYEEIERALDATGRSQTQAQMIYLIMCWLIPLMGIVAGFFIAGALGGLLIAGVLFVLPRRVIRGMGATAEKQQNIEAIELCHMTRMLMEAGLSIERAIRLIALQARPVMPHLCVRLDRFNRVMESGAERTEALDELGKNRQIQVLRNYVNLMKQSGSLGSGVSASLDQIIHEAHQNERSRLKEDTNRIGAKMTIVMMVFMLPALFILIGGPAVLSIAESLGS
ncbi:type II secretion system F family protein [Marinobacter salinexigens]|uniref:Type II secretion system F family protein n=1 Tax=Marinobacter salinexigens TaxID=2919747 RepID=A0A5B0VI65_9GAMM|nr:type II secretion system F family protein [Marinobacter salinexigens]KAA1174407.1 type II secretion system F family protein [Marinobacter salinexigens]